MFSDFVSQTISILFLFSSAKAWALQKEGSDASGYTASEDREDEHHTEPRQNQAAEVLDCDDGGDELTFWRLFRRVFAHNGPLAEETVAMAYVKWREWETFVDEMEASQYSGGKLAVTLPDEHWSDGSQVRTDIHSKSDLLKALQRAHYAQIFGGAFAPGEDTLASFLACPVGFVLVHYVMFLVHKTRSPDWAALDYWSSMSNAFGEILGTPSYALDHLESSRWSISSFDIAVNLNTEPGVWHRSYRQYCEAWPVPAPVFRTWREEWPGHVQIEAGGAHSLCQEGTHGGKLRIALIGEHAPSNLEHLSALKAALLDACNRWSDASEPSLEVAHFFTYLWNLDGTMDGDAVRSSLRMTWDAFWGSPLTVSQGRDAAEGPRWTVDRAVAMLGMYADKEPYLRQSQLRICSEPLWLCVLLHAATRGHSLLIRASAAGRALGFLVDFCQVFGREEVGRYWPHVRKLAVDATGTGSVSAASRITAEVLAAQAGLRSPYVPFLALHLFEKTSYSPEFFEILLYRSSLTGAPGFHRVLRLIAAELGVARRFVRMTQWSADYSQISKFLAVVMLPHIPCALRLADVYALGMPIFIPDQPLIHKFVWPLDPLPDLEGLVDVDAPERERPPYSPFEFQMHFPPRFDQFHAERRYWLQFSEWEVRPHLLRFASTRELVEQALSFSAEDALAVSRRMLEHHGAMALEALAYWKAAMLSVVPAGEKAEPVL
eukprot:TRINITY_DN27768_c0_g1_i1.p1 TRINITY_DN27768_c0_g1~~TRINITY_DN27768_c0_g1_i1.p1  ORF type:complete len:718 (+),score=61.70 TRINITY_DN27768_c0_g1_i1:182-2335(+)